MPTHITQFVYMKDQNTMKSIVALCKRRGVVFPGSDIYGGFANTYSYGHYGCIIKKNIKDAWLKFFVESKSDMICLDSPIMLNKSVWEASGHVSNFSDLLSDCKACKSRHRVDLLIKQEFGIDVDGESIEYISDKMQELGAKCPKCKSTDLTAPKQFNLMFETQTSKTGSGNEVVYLRPETAQGIFVDYINMCSSYRKKIPFGIAQIGKAFRNEITPGNFIFRTVEFEQMEIEYFVHPSQWSDAFDECVYKMKEWCSYIGLTSFSTVDIPKEKRAHYSSKSVDFVFDFPFGREELYGLAYRSDFDLLNHQNKSGKSFIYKGEDGKEYIPHVVEPSFGLDRTFLAVLCDAFCEEKLANGNVRNLLKIDHKIAPVKCAFFPIIDSSEEQIAIAKDLHRKCSKLWNVEIDCKGAIGKRYRKQDEIGTPFCVTVDQNTVGSSIITVRFRDTMKQVTIKTSDLIPFLTEHLL